MGKPSYAYIQTVGAFLSTVSARGTQERAICVKLRRHWHEREYLGISPGFSQRHVIAISDSVEGRASVVLV